MTCSSEFLRKATLSSPAKRYDTTRVLHPLNPKYDDIELHKDTEYRVIGVVTEKKERYR